MKTLEDYKKEAGYFATSEDVFGIITPPSFQCRNIDAMIDNMKQLTLRIDSIDQSLWRKEYDDMQQPIDEMYNYLIDKDTLEKLRRDIIDIREWGEDWKQLAKRIIAGEKVDIEKYI